MPAAFRVDRSVRFRPGPRELVRAGRLRAALREAGDPVGTDDLRGHGRRTNDLVAEQLAVTDAVRVRREHRIRGGRRVHAGIRNEQRLRDRTLPTRIRRPVQQLAFEGHRGRVARLEARAGHTAEPNELLRQLIVRQADAVADPSSINRDEHDRAVAPLADRRAREPRGEHGRGKILEGAEKGLAVAHQQRPAAERVDVIGPTRAEDVADRHTRPRGRLGVELLGGTARRREDRTAAGNRRVAALRELHHVAADVGPRRQRRKRIEDRLGRARRGRRGGSPGRGVQRDPTLVGGLVQAGERPALATSLPERVPGRVADVERPVRLDPDARTRRVWYRLQHAVLHHHPVGAAVGGVEEVTVDAGNRRRRRCPSLDSGQALTAGDSVVGKHRMQAPEPTRTRRHEHMDDDRSVGREQQLARIGEARNQRLRGRVRRRGEDARQQHCDEDPAQQD